MTTYCLASEYDRLSPEQKDAVDTILADDGEWSREMIALAIQFPLETGTLEEDWTKELPHAIV